MNIKITPGKTEFSKKILYVAAILNIAVIIFSCIMIYRTENLEPLIYLIPSTAAEVATGTAFYYNKAKAENKIKIEQKYGIKGDIDDDN